MLLGLEYIHDLNVLYRDLKPENIFIDIDGHLRLADFGLSRVRKDEEDPNSFCGTPEYLCKKFLVRVTNK